MILECNRESHSLDNYEAIDGLFHRSLPGGVSFRMLWSGGGKTGNDSKLERRHGGMIHSHAIHLIDMPPDRTIKVYHLSLIAGMALSPAVSKMCPVFVQEAQ